MARLPVMPTLRPSGATLTALGMSESAQSGGRLNLPQRRGATGAESRPMRASGVARSSWSWPRPPAVMLRMSVAAPMGSKV